MVLRAALAVKPLTTSKGSWLKTGTNRPMEREKRSEATANRRKHKGVRQSGQEYDFFVRRDMEAEEEKEPEEHAGKGENKDRRNKGIGLFIPD
jgi:hypothetical protein